MYEWIGVNNTVGGSGAVIPLYSNGGSSSGVASPFQDLPLDNIDQGAAKNQRLGTQITLKGMHLRFQFENDPNNQFFTQARIIVGWLDPNFGSVSSANLFYLPSVAGNTTVSAFLKGETHIDSVFRKVVVDRVVNIPLMNEPYTKTVTPQTICSKIVKMDIPFHNKKYQFISNTAGINGEHEDLWMFITAYAPGQSNLTQVANVRVCGRVYYKDG